jgi:CDP-4-dehydro-6-deoxyglucose reductase
MPIQLFDAQVSRVHDLTHDVRELDLDLLDPPEIHFLAGQFISFEIQPSGARRSVVRPYSVASPPQDSARIKLLFNLVPGGPGSTYLFSLKEGDQVRFKGVAGTFYLRKDTTRDLLFVATGTGIAPIRSMLLDYLGSGGSRSVKLFWGLRSQRDLYYQDELAALAAAHPNFTAVTTLSRPEVGWQGAIGRVTRLVEERISSVNNLAVYLCGNGGMIKDVSEIVNRKGLCPIYREKYYDDKTLPDD